MLKRSEFLQLLSVVACPSVALAAAESCLSGCAGQIPAVQGKREGRYVRVPRSALPPNAPLLVRAQGIPIDIALVSRSAGLPLALSTVCTHAGCDLRVLPSGFECPCHGSLFDREGTVVEGPAKTPLQRFTLTAEDKDYLIEVMP